MPVFPVTDVAFTGFRVVRERPRAVAVWVLLQLALSLSLGALAVEMAGPRLASIEALGATSHRFLPRSWPSWPASLRSTRCCSSSPFPLTRWCSPR